MTFLAAVLLFGVQHAGAWGFKAGDNYYSSCDENFQPATFYTDGFDNTVDLEVYLMTANQDFGWFAVSQGTTNYGQDSWGQTIGFSGSFSNGTVVRATALWYDDPIYLMESKYTVILPGGNVSVTPAGGSAIEMTKSGDYIYTAIIPTTTSVTISGDDPGTVNLAYYDGFDASMGPQANNTRLVLSNVPVTATANLVKVTYNLSTNQVTFENSHEFPMGEIGAMKQENVPFTGGLAGQTVSFKIVTIGQDFWMYNKVNADCSINGNAYSSQARVTPTGGARSEYWFSQRVGGTSWNRRIDALDHSGAQYNYTIANSPNNQYTIHLYQELNLGTGQTNDFTYYIKGPNKVETDVVAPVLTKATKMTSADEIKFQFTATDDSGDYFYYIKIKDDLGVETHEVAFTSIYSWKPVAGRTYEFEVYAVDFDRNISEPLIAEEGLIFIPTENLALNKTSTASFGTASNGNDGSVASRWRTDGNGNQQSEWWMVDLGTDYVVNNVIIRMNGDAGARGAIYDIQVSLTGEDGDWTTVVSGAQIPAGSGTEFNDHDFTPIPARYVKYQGISKGGWDHNFAEFEVYGTGFYDPNNVELASVAVSAPTSLIYTDETSSVQFSYVALDGSGNTFEVDNLDNVEWSVSPTTATIVGGLFVPSAPDNYTITCKVTKDGVEKSGTATITVRAPKVLSSIVLSSPKTLYGLGEPFSYTTVQKDQFGQDFGAAMSWKVNDSPVDGVFTTAEKGDYTVKVYNGSVESNTLTIKVVSPKINSFVTSVIATGDGATGTPISLLIGTWRTSTFMDGNPADPGVAGYPPAGSNYPVDLVFNFGTGNNYMLDYIQINWEGACARDFDVSVGSTLIDAVTGFTVPQAGNKYYQVNANNAASDVITFNLKVPYTGYGYNLLNVNFYGGKKPTTVPGDFKAYSNDPDVICWTVADGLAIDRFEIYKDGYVVGKTEEAVVPHSGALEYCYDLTNKVVLKATTGATNYEVVLVDPAGGILQSGLIPVESTVTGIVTPTANQEVVKTQYFTIDGRQVSNPGAGLYLVKKTYKDNSVKTEKALIK